MVGRMNTLLLPVPADAAEVPGNFSTPRGYIEVGMPREDTTPSQALVV